MNIPKNVGVLDRAIRLVLAVVLLLIAYFWTSGAVGNILYVLAGAMLVTSVFRFCGIYTLFKVNTCPVHEKVSLKAMIGLFLLLAAIGVAGVYGSIFFSKKFFLEDFATMNQFYKQTLFFTGQNNRDESVKNYEKLMTEYEAFYAKYSKYHPYRIASDTHFNQDILSIKEKIASLRTGVISGDLPFIHTEFETIRPIFQDILKRNGFSMLSVYLVDFHDVMEKVIAKADVKDAGGVLSVYSEANLALQTVESVANDSEIQTIRQKLEQVVASAKTGNKEVLPAQAAELKSSFVKVYLKRG